MKKLLPILILLAFIAFCYQLIVTFFISEHEIEYSLIASDQAHYTISEKYQKEGQRHYYSFVIHSNNDYYTMAVEEDFGKQDRVITDIKYYKKNNLKCIFPIYKRDHKFDVSCILDEKQVIPTYLIQSNNKDFLYIAEKFAKDGYDEIYYQLNNTPKKEENMLIYYDYIPDDFTFAIWNYKGINILKKDSFEEKIFLNNDHYENDLSAVAGKYYVTVNTDNEGKQLTYNQLIIYNLQDGGKTLVDVDLSQNSYFNGTYKKQLYITDPDVKKQYVLDPRKKELTEVSSEVKIVNNTLKPAGKDFYQSPEIDIKKYKNKMITELYDTTDIQKSGSDYYFKTSDEKLYRVIQNDYRHPILLYQSKNIKEWSAHDDGVSFIVDDTLYFYSDFYGLKPIMINPEFKYNSKNIVHFIREE